MTNRRQVVEFFIGFLIFGSFLEVQSCGSLNFSLELIQNAGANIMTDPVGVGKTLKGFVCVEPCTEIVKSIEISKAAFDLAMIDLQLVLAQTEADAVLVVIEHLTNTNPILLTSLILVITSFVQGIAKLQYFICENTLFVGSTLLNAIPQIQDHVSDAQNTIAILQNCAQEKNVYLKEDIPTQHSICVRKVVNDFTMDFNTYLADLARYKFFGPDVNVEMALCLLKKESNLELKEALDTSRCLGYAEKYQLDQFYKIFNLILGETVDVMTKLQITIANVQKCGRFYVDKLYEIISNENVMCNVIGCFEEK